MQGSQTCVSRNSSLESSEEEEGWVFTIVRYGHSHHDATVGHATVPTVPTISAIASIRMPIACIQGLGLRVWGSGLRVEG